MAFFKVRTADVQADRRVTRRFVVECPARLSLAGGDREGRISDLSEHGARLETATPPMPGTTGFLQFNGQDHYCKVVWTVGSSCGLQFERPISVGVVEATCSHVEISLKSVATVRRIPLGRRRNGLVPSE